MNDEILCDNTKCGISLGEFRVSHGGYNYCSMVCAEIDGRSGVRREQKQARLASVGQVTMLSSEDRETLRIAQTWARKLDLQARRLGPDYYVVRFDELDYRSLQELGAKLTEILSPSDEPQLTNSNIGGNDGR